MIEAEVNFMLKFVHMADAHLGYRQYNCDERAIDFAQAFLSVIKFAIERKVDFILIAGDLFHKKSDIDPLTLAQATKALEKAKNAGIPVIAVEGNHDSTYFKESFSWLDYLAKSGLIVNLKPSFDEGSMIIEEWNGESGAYIDLDYARIYGMKYYGALTEKILEDYSRKIRKNGFTIFMAHVGIEGYMNLYGCISSNKLHRLKGKVDYVALGHIHKSFVEDDFIFNPGSLETCDITELEFKRGFFYVEVDDGIRYRLIENERRDFVLLNYKMESPDYDELRRFLLKRRRKTNPVVDLTITTTRSVRRMLDEDRIKRIVRDVFDPIVVRVRWEIEDGFYSVRLNFDDRESIERSVIKQILENYDYGDISDEVLRLKSIFCSSFNVAMVDKLVEDILLGDKAEETKLTEPKQAERVEAKRPILKLTDLIDVKQAKPKTAKVEEEEVWDWRRVYDKRGKARKR